MPQPPWCFAIIVSKLYLLSTIAYTFCDFIVFGNNISSCNDVDESLFGEGLSLYNHWLLANKVFWIKNQKEKT